MKSLQPPASKNRALALIVGLLVIVGICYGVYMYLQASAPSTEKVNQGKDDAKSTSENDRVDSPSKSDSTENPSSPNEDYVASPNRDVETDEPYPIDTPHYKIEQVSKTRYRITLYPLVNNSDPDSYDFQLRQYKQEALDYLGRRYDDTSSYHIDWSPDRANDI